MEHESRCGCKVGAALAAKEVRVTNADLAARWTDPDRESTRTLADRFNVEVLRAAMHEAGMTVIEGEAKNLYELLTDADKLEASRMQAESTLERNGIDVEDLVDRFVSHQTMYRHLTTCLEVEHERPTATVATERDTIEGMRTKAELVLEDSVSRLRSADRLDLRSFDVLVNFRVTCNECGRMHDIVDVLDTGGCECVRESNTS